MGIPCILLSVPGTSNGLQHSLKNDNHKKDESERGSPRIQHLWQCIRVDLHRPVTFHCMNLFEISCRYLIVKHFIDSL